VRVTVEGKQHRKTAGLHEPDADASEAASCVEHDAVSVKRTRNSFFPLLLRDDNSVPRVNSHERPLCGRAGRARLRLHTATPAVNLDEILCAEQERQVLNDNCVSYGTLRLNTPASLMRAHFVTARVKAHVYPDGSHALFQGPAAWARYGQNGANPRCENRRLNSLSGALTDMWTGHPACPRSHRRTEPEEADI
jgi:hypothetical protein